MVNYIGSFYSEMWYGRYKYYGIDRRNRFKHFGWNYKVHLGKTSEKYTDDFIQACKKLWGCATVPWSKDNRGGDGKWLLDTERDGTDTVYITYRCQAEEIQMMMACMTPMAA